MNWVIKAENSMVVCLMVWELLDAKVGGLCRDTKKG